MADSERGVVSTQTKRQRVTPRKRQSFREMGAVFAPEVGGDGLNIEKSEGGRFDLRRRRFEHRSKHESLSGRHMKFTVGVFFR